MPRALHAVIPIEIDALYPAAERGSVVADVVPQVDHWPSLPVGTPRNSVRLQSKDLFAGGLIVIDLALMPWGCGVWPAFWTLGYDKTWPDAGEVDIIEGIMSNTNNHTLPGCSINQTAGLYTGTVGNQLCDSTTGGSGCSISSDSATSYGEPFNSAGGGVFACLWDTDGIRIWNWNRAGIPSDISSDAPDPTTWGTPAAAFDASTCNPGYYFRAAELILNIDLCGDWAGNNYAQYSYCPGTCASYVSDPTNLNNTIFLINYIRVFQQSGSQPLDQQVDVVSNLTGAGGAVGMTSVSSSPSRTTTISGSTAATGSGKASSAGEMRATTRALSLGLILALGASGGFCLLL